ncbi:MAG TPA: FtsX-like permease family protein, partial [Planctomycetia bacterium]|nr:FtsX-like permease family protein [Planctomycetia bacterium]
VFELADRRWIVKGVLQSTGSAFDSEIWAKRSLVSQIFAKESYTTVVLKTENETAAKALAEDLKSNYTKAKLNALPEREYYAAQSGTNIQFAAAIGVIALFMAIGGMFGVMNTMFAAIAQRSKDIGVLRIVGFSRGQVLTAFVFESLVLALVGGGLGCLAALLFNGASATSTISGGAGFGKTILFKLTVDANVLSIGFTFGLAMGLLGGIIPAISAMLVRPLESLR